MESLGHKAISAMIKENKELRKDPWIPVSERLPESNKLVFGYTEQDGNILGIRYIMSENNWCTDYIRWSGSKITHWMPLPEPPTEMETLLMKIIEKMEKD